MYVSFARGILEKEEHFTPVSDIFSLFFKGRHRWMIPVNDDGAALQSRYCQDSGHMGKRARELYQKSLVFAPGPGDQFLEINEIPKEPHEMSPSVAADYLSQPLSIAVEDSRSDGTFLSLLATAFSKKKVKKAIDCNDIIYEHGGGSGLARRVAELAERKQCPPRLFVLSDSDRLGPGPLPQKLDSLIHTCDQHSAMLRILEKREMENYIPPKLIRAWLKKQRPSELSLQRTRCLDTFEGLSEQQKSFFDMKNGFSRLDRLREEDRATQNHLYSDLDDNQRAVLESGFSSDVWMALETGHTKSLPGDLRRHATPGASRGDSEVEQLIRDIESLL